jgi:predicted component of type VI protein secretion system
MDRQQLLDRLRELHAELQNSSSTDAEERELLQKLAKDIELLLNHREGELTLSSASFRRRLEEAVLRLEASHPRTTMLIGRVIDMLVQMGI